MSGLQEFNPQQEALAAIQAIFTTVIALAITVVHSHKFYQDFFTKERVSVQYRRIKPIKNWAYVKSSYLTLATLYLYTSTLVSLSLQYSATHIANTCNVALICSTFLIFASKACLYLSYVFRLHQIYGPSAYGYSPKKLLCLAITAIIFNVTFFVLFFIGYYFTGNMHTDIDGKFPYHCSSGDNPYGEIAGGSMILFEVVASVMTIWGFSRPLNKVVAALNESNRKNNQKILYSGYKYKVLVIAASFSTLLWICLYLVVPSETPGSIVLTLDYLVNPVCLLLMTSYYPSNLYYERLCYLCICCCGHKKEDYQSKTEIKSKVKLAVDLNKVDSKQETPHETPQDEDNVNP